VKEYDIVVIGSGCGLSIVAKALERNLRVALVAEKYLGGTCFNVGCVPSKTLIYTADRVLQIGEAEKFGIGASLSSIDFGAIMERTRGNIKRGVEFQREWVEHTGNLDFYEVRARFAGDYLLETADGRQIKGGKIFIASGASPAIPPIDGLSDVGYLTNETLLALTERPESMVIIGGGYIAVEYGHFFAAMGTKVTIIEMGESLVANEEPEISRLLHERLSSRMSVMLSAALVKVSKNGTLCTLRTRTRDGMEQELTAEKILVAAGRKSNAPSLTPEATGVELNEAGYVKVDEYLQTTKKNIWAVGDATGRQMFTHAADREVEVAWHNAMSEEVGAKRRKMDFSLVPHAIFTHPQIAALGMRESEAKTGRKVLVGRALYSDTVQGDVRMEQEGFAKALVEKKTERILGFHIIGPQAPELIQEVVNAMTKGLGAKAVTESIHIFPAMSELIPEVFNNLE
jgi:dihydrolipoamide dehydrogenase